ncbi:MAG TPA: hypothetical protein VGI26_02555 [Solirubrobacteraceae bacterium]
MSECSKCGAQMQDGQDWCLQCGAGKPDSLGIGGPGWRTGAAILGATALLVCGASVAAYAALTKTKPKPRVVAVVKPTTVPPTTTPGTIPPTGTTVPGTPTTVSPGTPTIPSTTPTPTSTNSEPVFPPETKTTETTTKSTETKSSEKTTAEKEKAEAPSPILLDTNAASTYNPYSYPATLFGDPSLAIDGETKTAWTAQVQAEKAPNMAEGLLLDLKSPQKVGSATVIVTTAGATIEIYGANGKTVPGSITDTGWKRLVGLKVLKKKSTHFTLNVQGKSYRYIVLWLAKAPTGSTAAKPGTVAINEFELFPPK